uniref:DUF4834 domain-containing protein n=2 Tax=Caenorhabditis tropicalis TaxID=1561998 RepID=A0A1I7TID0_9PELO
MNTLKAILIYQLHWLSYHMDTSTNMTPVVIVPSTTKDDEEGVEGVLMLLGIGVFFCLLYLAMVFYRRFRKHFNWLESVTMATRNTRVEYANRAHNNDDVESAPKKATIVRFVIDGRVLEDEE